MRSDEAIRFLAISFKRFRVSKETVVTVAIRWFVTLSTAYTWRREFQQGKAYYAIVQACNGANLCRVTSSTSLTFDTSPPTVGHATVGFGGRHSKFFGHK